MNKGRIKETLDFIVAICSIVSCIVAVYGVSQVVNFVIDVRPIVVPIAQEMKEGNLDVQNLLKGSKTTVKFDTVRVRDTIYLSSDKKLNTTSFSQIRQNRGLTQEEEARLDNSSNNISEQEQQDIDDAESNFRQRMRNKMKSN